MSFCDIRNNQGLGKCYQPQPSARLGTPRPLIIPDITKSHSIGVQYIGTGEHDHVWKYVR